MPRRHAGAADEGIASPTGGDNNINNDEQNHDQGGPTSCRAMQTDPIEERIAICQTWQVADFKKPLYDMTEVLECRGLKHAPSETSVRDF